MRNKIILLVGSVIFALLLAEIGTRVYLNYFASNKVLQRFGTLSQLNKRQILLQTRFIPHAHFEYALRPGYQNNKGNLHNSLGFRGDEFPKEKPEGEYRIICIGGSTTYTTKLEDYQLSYPYLLEQYLHKNGLENYRVINAGVPGWKTYQSLINFQLRLLDLKPDLIVVYHAINDTRLQFVWPPEVYQDELLLHQTPIKAPSTFLWSNISTLVRVISVLNGDTPPANLQVFDRNSTNSYIRDFNQQIAKGNYPEGIFDTIPAIQMIQTNLPIHYQKNLTLITQLAKANDVEILLSSFASSSSSVNSNSTIQTEEIQLALKQHNQAMLDVSKKEETHFIDLQELLGDDAALFVDGIHVNEKGSRKKAQHIGDYIIRHIGNNLTDTLLTIEPSSQSSLP